MSFEVRAECRRGDRTIAIDFASDSRLTALVGRSGAGKSTVLHMVAGLVRPDRGRIVAGDTVLFDSARGIDLAVPARQAGYVFQDNRLFPHRRVADNLRYGAKLAPAGAAGLDFTAVVDFLGIGHLLNRWPLTLSGGEARRVAIGRALLAGARFLLLDEPLASLDRARRDELLAMIEHIRDDLRLPVLYVSHDPAEVTRLAGTVISLDDL